MKFHFLKMFPKSLESSTAHLISIDGNDVIITHEISQKENRNNARSARRMERRPPVTGFSGGRVVDGNCHSRPIIYQAYRSFSSLTSGRQPVKVLRRLVVN